MLKLDVCAAEALQNMIRNVTVSIVVDERQHVLQGFLQHCEMCLRAEGIIFCCHISYLVLICKQEFLTTEKEYCFSRDLQHTGCLCLADMLAGIMEKKARSLHCIGKFLLVLFALFLLYPICKV
jgi:hypothetical protein